MDDFRMARHRSIRPGRHRPRASSKTGRCGTGGATLPRLARQDGLGGMLSSPELTGAIIGVAGMMVFIFFLLKLLDHSPIPSIPRQFLEMRGFLPTFLNWWVGSIDDSMIGRGHSHFEPQHLVLKKENEERSSDGWRQNGTTSGLERWLSKPTTI